MSNNTSRTLEAYADIFRALANPHRLAIFLRLVRCCAPDVECCPEGQTCPCVGEFAEELGLAPSTVSHHIKELCRAGLIHTQRQGQAVHCWVQPETLANLAGFFLRRAQQCPGLQEEQLSYIISSLEER